VRRRRPPSRSGTVAGWQVAPRPGHATISAEARLHHADRVPRRGTSSCQYRAKSSQDFEYASDFNDASPNETNIMTHTLARAVTPGEPWRRVSLDASACSVVGPSVTRAQFRPLERAAPGLRRRHAEPAAPHELHRVQIRFRARDVGGAAPPSQSRRPSSTPGLSPSSDMRPLRRSMLPKAS
jgi:hypothetical protein